MAIEREVCEKDARKEGEISGYLYSANVVVDIVQRERTKALVDRHCLSVDGVRKRSHMTRVIDPGQRRALSNPTLQPHSMSCLSWYFPLTVW